MTLAVDGAKVRAIAIYLAQFHPIPENDEWWGRGFTEWTNVARSVPLFPGHPQPQVPADLGFYDLRLGETREAQAALARAYGIEGFCYYHYWFNGRRLIERPFDEVLQSGKPDFPFCLFWANETWSRRWLGDEQDILVEQTYSPEDDLRHAQWLAHAFSDPRYLKVRGRPLFLIYRPRHLPDPRRTTDVLREQCLRAGIPEPYLVGTDAHCRDFDSRNIGFDDTLNFMPQLGVLPHAFGDGFSRRRLLRNLRFRAFNGRTKLYRFDEAWRLMFDARPQFPHLPSVFVGWDNTPRRGRDGIVIADPAPAHLKAMLTEAMTTIRARPAEEKIIFINAWNEWAEGNHLEPDLKSGHGFLQAVADVLGHQPATNSNLPGVQRCAQMR